jgi:hypothetical protein
MTVPPSSLPPRTDDEVVRTYARITVGFCGALGLVLVLGLTVLSSHASVGTRGVLIGLGLGLCSWFGSRWITSFGLSRSARTGRGEAAGLRATAGATELAGTAGTIAFMGICVAQVPGLLGFVLARGDGADVGPMVVAIPIAIVAIVVNASGPGAMRRHLERLRTVSDD